MIVELPAQQEIPFGEIKDGILFIYDLTKFEEIMYELTYCLKEKKCVYCGKEIQEEECTLDHLYPRGTGGISVTNNLSPCCSRCNSTKNDLTYREFLGICELPKGKKKEYLEKAAKYNRSVWRRFGYKLPKKWVTYQDVESISCKGAIWPCQTGRKYRRLEEFYFKYKKLPLPSVIDMNNNLLGNYTVLMLARRLGLKQIPVIKLENVALVCDE